ncbi:RDD family protein [Chitinophaga alhagiae]|uniref:RDD family protein n=1 Tax=Chitinophaga alhagiae TaxID=2203219 RepID=UPI000E5ABF2C|nr:RDD family protein [Chitinophaga alhagiae]
MKETSPHLLEEFDQELAIAPVSKGTRFANYLVDNICFQVLYYLVYDLWQPPRQTTAWSDRLLTDLAVSFTLYFVYYLFFESVLKGRTPGKLVTGTVALKDNGGALTFNDVLKRSLYRLIPIEPLSIFWGEVWHDSFTNTIVTRKIK